MDLDPLLLSFEVAALATLLAAVVGIAVAALLANARFPGHDLVDVLFTVPMVLPPTVLGYYLLMVLGRESAIGGAFRAVFGMNVVFTRAGAVVAATVAAMPLVVKSVRAALEDTDPTLVLAARTLGASPLRAFFTVQLPLATRGIAASLMLAFTRALGEFGVTLMIAGNIPGVTRTAPLAIFDHVQAHRERDAAVLSVVLTAFAIAVLWVTGKLTRRRLGP